MNKSILTPLFVLALAACTPKADNTTTKTSTPAATDKSSGTQSPSSSTLTQATSEPLFSNLADQASFDEVKRTLGKSLASDNVNTVMDWVHSYNTAIKNTSLLSGFAKQAPTYDTVKIDELWASANNDFIGTNCRINTYSLLKDVLKIDGTGSSDDALLFMDHDAISTGKLMNEADLAKFNRLYARVKTEPTKDVQVHAAKMAAHFDGIAFDDKATMLSVVLHDDIDGDYLFIGHVGVLVPSEQGYLFIEKISFQEPYQAVKFADKDSAYRYLLDKYAVDYDQPTAQPFIMENDKLVKWVDKSS